MDFRQPVTGLLMAWSDGDPAALGVSTDTMSRDWKAKAWLACEFAGSAEVSGV